MKCKIRSLYFNNSYHKDLVLVLAKMPVKVPPRFELGSLDSESRVLTITPWNPIVLISRNLQVIELNITREYNIAHVVLGNLNAWKSTPR